MGEMHESRMMRFIVDQLTEGQLEWVPMPAAYDAVVLGEPKRSRAHHVLTGRKEYFDGLRKRFPGETAAIDELEQLTQVPGARARSHSLRSRGRGWDAWLRFLTLESRRGKEVLPLCCPGDSFLATTQHSGVAQPASAQSVTVPNTSGEKPQNLHFVPQKPCIAHRAFNPSKDTLDVLRAGREQ